MENDTLAPSAVAPPPDHTLEFDAWLRGHLNRLHAAVLWEPVPERFLRLLDAPPEPPRG
jgi:hypothetical protein